MSFGMNCVDNDYEVTKAMLVKNVFESDIWNVNQ